MNTVDMAQKLISLGKKGYMCNYQDNKLAQDAGKRMLALQDKIDALMTEIADKDEKICMLESEKTILEERIAIMLEDEADGDPPFEPLDAAAPGEAAEDFWDDDWPLGDQ